MASYASKDELKRQLNITSDVDTDLLGWALDSAEAAVNAYCGRAFVAVAEDAEATARIFNAAAPVMCDDFTSLELVEESSNFSTWTTVAASTYHVEPFNAASFARPYTTIAASSGWYPARWVRVTATWGWPATPPEVKSATLIKAARIFKRKDSPNGIEGGADFGVAYVSRREDADVVMFLSREDMYVTPEQWAQQHPDLPESAYPKGVAQVSVAKHRNGPTQTITVAHQLHLSRFVDMARD